MSISVTESVSAVSFNNVPLYKTIMEDTLTAVANAGINIDMISMTTPTSEIFSFGFTVDDETTRTIGDGDRDGMVMVDWG